MGARAGAFGRKLTARRKLTAEQPAQGAEEANAKAAPWGDVPPGGAEWAGHFAARDAEKAGVGGALVSMLGREGLEV